MMDKKLLALLVVTAVVVSGILLSSPESPSLYRYYDTIFGECLIIFISAFIGFDRVKSFTMKSAMGRSLAFILTGMLMWGFGNLAWLYYNVVMGIELPYPSLADVGYIGMIPFASFGLLLLLRSVKIKFDKAAILKITLIPIAMFLVTYLLFIQSKLAEDADPVVKILNVAYPVGDVVFLSFGLAILSLVKGGKMFRPIGIICAGFIVEAVADFVFSWSTSTGTYYVGSLADLFFALAFFTLGLGMYYIKDITRIEMKGGSREKD
jgi:hypothetical protein